MIPAATPPPSGGIISRTGIMLPNRNHAPGTGIMLPGPESCSQTGIIRLNKAPNEIGQVPVVWASSSLVTGTAGPDRPDPFLAARPTAAFSLSAQPSIG